MSFVKDIHERISILEFVTKHTGHCFRQLRGREYWLGQCPFCQNKKVFWVNTLTGFCGCWRAKCQADAPGGGRPMDVINFYARLYHVDNSQAIADLGRLL